MTASTSDAPGSMALLGQRVALVGRMAGMSQRDAQQLVRQHGAAVVDPPDASATLVVVGENESLLDDGSLDEKLKPGFARRPIGDRWKSSAKASFGSGWDWSIGSTTFITCIRRWPCWPSCWASPVDDSPLAAAGLDRAGSARCGGCPTSTFKRWPRPGG